MKIRCSQCGQQVSNADIPEDAVLRAWIECHECIRQIRTRANGLLHRLWTKAVGTPGYIKAEWMELEQIVWHAKL